MKWVVGGTAIAVAGLAFAVWFLILRSDAPPPVSLDAAVGALTTTTEPTAGTTAQTIAAQTTTAQAPVGASGSTDGAWALDTSLDSFVGYRVQEELAGIGTTTAAGRTSAVTGSIEINGASITSVEVLADFTELESDSRQRDNQLRSRGLETNDFPTASFVLTTPIVLSEPPTEGVAVSAIAQGDLTVHGVTRGVEIPIDAQLTAGVIAIVGSLDVKLTDFNIEAPTGLRVLSIDDDAVMEFQLFYAPA